MAPLPAPAEKPSHRVSDSQSHAKVRPPTQVAVFCAALWLNLQPALTGPEVVGPSAMRTPCADRHRPGPLRPRLSPAHCANHPAALRSPCASCGSAMRRNAPDSLGIGSSYTWPGRCVAFPGPQRAGLSDRRVQLFFIEIRIGGVTISVPQTRHPRSDSSRTRGQSPGNPRLHLDHRPRFGYEAIYDRTALAASQPRRFIAKAQGES